MEDTLELTKANNSFALNNVNIDYNFSKKILTFDKLAAILASVQKNQTIALCHGVFDLMHVGHIRHFREAKSYVDILIVTVTPDRYVNKGPHRPYFTEVLRAESIASLSDVDYVIINDEPTAINAITKVKPNFYIKGIEYKNLSNDLTGKIIEEELAVKSNGGQIKFTNDIVFSSSSILNRFYSPFSSDVQFYLENFKKRYSVGQIIDFLNNASQLKVLLIGEAILDIYSYGEVIGKSGKEPVLVSKSHREEMYAGGVLSIANHLSSFCREVTCITMLGEQKQYENYIRSKLHQNVKPIFHYKKDSPTIIKRRFIEEYTLQKLFETYEINDSYLDSEQQKIFVQTLKTELPNYDLVIIADYGHGLLDEMSISEIEMGAKFLAVNTQSNASNHGFNCISKYTKANYICIANRELQLNYRQKNISTAEQLQKLIQEFNYKNAIITSGRNGSLAYNEIDGICSVPAFATEIKDRVGAGDAVLAVTSLCVVQNAPAELVGYIGNVVGAQAVNIIGNEHAIDKTSLLKYIQHMLK